MKSFCPATLRRSPALGPSAGGSGAGLEASADGIVWQTSALPADVYASLTVAASSQQGSKEASVCNIGTLLGPSGSCPLAAAGCITSPAPACILLGMAAAFVWAWSCAVLQQARPVLHMQRLC